MLESSGFMEQVLGLAFLWLVRKMHNWFPLGSRSPTGSLGNSPCQSAFNASMQALKHWSAFQWYDHLAVILFSSLGREDIINHIEALMKFTQQALNDSNQAIGLLSLEVSMMRKVALQDCMVLDIVTPSQGETCYNTEYWVFIPDESSNVSCLMTPKESIFPYKRSNPCKLSMSCKVMLMPVVPESWELLTWRLHTPVGGDSFLGSHCYTRQTLAFCWWESPNSRLPWGRIAPSGSQFWKLDSYGHFFSHQFSSQRNDHTEKCKQLKTKQKMVQSDG